MALLYLQLWGGRKDHLPLEFTFGRRPPIGFSIGIPRRDVNTSSTWMRPTKSQPVTEKLASLGPARSFWSRMYTGRDISLKLSDKW